MTVPGKVVAITGGARGIGLAIATALNSQGARVAIGDIDEATVGESGRQLGLEVACRLDVTDRPSFTSFLDATEQHLGPIDVLVNNAGVIAVGSAVAEPDDVTRRLLDYSMSMSLGSSWAPSWPRTECCRAAVGTSSTSPHWAA